MLNEIGGEVYQSWSEEKKRGEIGNLVQGYRNGMPARFMCQIAIAIAGGVPQAKKHFKALLSRKEREAIVTKGGAKDPDDRELLASVLL